jgi:hypothetical protein
VIGKDVLSRYIPAQAVIVSSLNMRERERRRESEVMGVTSCYSKERDN